MKLILHAKGSDNELTHHYQRAFANATELFIVSAYLTEWDKTLKLNSGCKKFRIIIGKDFGITRIAACKDVMQWLPAYRKAQFFVADGIGGFHPKAIFWKEPNGKTFAVVGSSNLTEAAFKTNCEANVYGSVSATAFEAAKQWVAEIEDKSVVVAEDWLTTYKEAKLRGKGGGGGANKPSPTTGEEFEFRLPRPKAMHARLEERRKQLAAYRKHKDGLMKLFRSCAKGGKAASSAFFKALPDHWGHELGNRLQGAGWERQGKSSRFDRLATSFLAIVDAPTQDRDDVVTEQIDLLHEQRNHARTSFLSEMLCLYFPERYPVLNDPIRTYLRHVKFKAPRGASEGARYVDLATKLRRSLIRNPDHPAKNLAELDTVIWAAFGKRKATAKAGRA